MKKNKLILIGIIVIIIIVAIAILNKVMKDESSKLSKVYEKMIGTQTYTFTTYDLGEKNKKTTYRKVDKTLIDQYELGEHRSTLVVEGDTYLIAHETEEYFYYPNNNLDEETLTKQLEKIVNLKYLEGKEKVYGKTYKYEEYAGVSYFATPAVAIAETEGAKTRFYFKGNELVYLKTIYDTINEKTGEKMQAEELQTVKIKYEVENGVFTRPQNYAEN